MAVSESTDDYINHGRKLWSSNSAASFLCSPWKQSVTFPLESFSPPGFLWIWMYDWWQPTGLERTQFSEIWQCFLVHGHHCNTLPQHSEGMVDFAGLKEDFLRIFFTLEKEDGMGKPKMEVDGRWVSFSIGWIFRFQPFIFQGVSLCFRFGAWHLAWHQVDIRLHDISNPRFCGRCRFLGGCQHIFQLSGAISYNMFKACFG